MPDRRLAPFPYDIHQHLGEFPASLFDEAFYRSWELVVRYAEEWVVDLVGALGLEEDLREGVSVGELARRRGFAEAFLPTLEWLLRSLAERGLLEGPAEAGEGLFRLVTPLPATDRERVRGWCLGEDPANAPALDLLDAAAAAYPAVASGATSGRDAMFGLGQTRLWLEYFDNRNPTYAVNNRLAAHAAARRLGPAPARVLEIGGGGGSGAEALIEELRRLGRERDLAAYRFTEPSPFFRRRAERRLREVAPEVPWELAALDVDRDFTAQGAEAAAWDLLYAVNVLHVAHDLDASLARMREALRPGGWLVAAEAIRPFPGRTIATELVFQLLEDYGDVALDPERRPTPGFLTPDQWARLAEDAGFEAVEVLPDHGRIGEVYPRFFTGVLVGRR